ncbi:hypothetical protein PsYK624_163270 [Phanerochaete sordida]|uniref:Uncharacterized protein n=1 Tax=Phanerochaete sordida TaxID=48140 RepID=A0A9P3GT44_9APHY|nr:hypothetical protein PsYK624_163270 [Phanerochaete sordida]
MNGFLVITTTASHQSLVSIVAKLRGVIFVSDQRSEINGYRDRAVRREGWRIECIHDLRRRERDPGPPHPEARASCR